LMTCIHIHAYAYKYEKISGQRHQIFFKSTSKYSDAYAHPHCMCVCVCQNIVELMYMLNLCIVGVYMQRHTRTQIHKNNYLNRGVMFAHDPGQSRYAMLVHTRPIHLLSCFQVCEVLIRDGIDTVLFPPPVYSCIYVNQMSFTERTMRTAHFSTFSCRRSRI
jgi:hypothetical protein